MCCNNINHLASEGMELLGYIPGVSSVIGVSRLAIGGIIAIISVIASSFFSFIGKEESSKSFSDIASKATKQCARGAFDLFFFVKWIYKFAEISLSGKWDGRLALNMN